MIFKIFWGMLAAIIMGVNVVLLMLAVKCKHLAGVIFHFFVVVFLAMALSWYIAYNFIGAY